MLTNTSKPILVTGCAGFIGARTTELLLDQGFQVVGVDNFNDYYDQRLKLYRLSRILGQEKTFTDRFSDIPAHAPDIPQWIETLRPNHPVSSGFTFHLMDIECQPEIDALVARVQPAAVINLAARAGVRASLENPQLYVNTNVLGCLHLLEACRRHNVPKFVLASTSSLYAGQPMPFHEDLPVNTPISPYAATKKSAEMLCYTWHYLHNLNISVLRYFTVYGPAGRPDMSILRFIRWIDQGTPITIYGDGNQSRDFTFIDDIARGTISSLNLTGHHTINLGGGGDPVSLIDVIHQLEVLLGAKATLRHEDFQKSDIHHTRASNDLAAQFLGWLPSVDIFQGLNESVNWYLQNKSWSSQIDIR